MPCCVKSFMIISPGHWQISLIWHGILVTFIFICLSPSFSWIILILSFFLAPLQFLKYWLCGVQYPDINNAGKNLVARIQACNRPVFVWIGQITLLDINAVLKILATKCCYVFSYTLNMRRLLSSSQIFFLSPVRCAILFLLMYLHHYASVQNKMDGTR